MSCTSKELFWACPCHVDCISSQNFGLASLSQSIFLFFFCQWLVNHLTNWSLDCCRAVTTLGKARGAGSLCLGKGDTFCPRAVLAELSLQLAQLGKSFWLLHQSMWNQTFTRSSPNKTDKAANQFHRQLNKQSECYFLPYFRPIISLDFI